MKLLVIISTDDSETIFNAMRLANIAEQKGDETRSSCWAKGCASSAAAASISMSKGRSTSSAGIFSSEGYA
jgi:hypothetical protein